MKLFILLASIGILLAGCADEFTPSATQTVYVPVAASPTPAPAESDIQLQVDQYNQYREQLGQEPLTPGLGCSVQLVSSGQWLSSSSPGYNSSQGTLVVSGTSYSFLASNGLDQPNASSGSNSILPVSIQPLFVNFNYKINCNGYLVVTDNEYYGFDTNSDDGSILTIDGSQVVNNDGNHAMKLVSGTKLLQTGVHTFNVQYAQSGLGSFGLIVDMNGSPVPSANLYH